MALTRLKKRMKEGTIGEYANNLATAVASIGATATTLIIDTPPKDLTGNLTIPSTLSLVWHDGCSIGGSYTLTINGDIQAGNYRIFDNEVTISNLKKSNVKWFGAVGNGSTNDYAQLTKAFDGTIMEIYMPDGTYITNSEVYVQDGVTVKGDGIENTTIKATTTIPAESSIIRNDNQDFDPDNFTDQGITIKDICFDGNYSGGAPDSSAGMLGLAKTKNTTVKQCKFVNCQGYGITDNGNLGLTIRNCEFSAIEQDFLNSCIRCNAFNDGTESQKTTITDCYFKDITAIGIELESTNTVVSNCHFDDVGARGINMFSNADSCQIIGNYIHNVNEEDSVSSRGISVEGDGHLISDNIIDDVEGIGVYLNATNTLFHGNKVKNYRSSAASYPSSIDAPGILIDADDTEYLTVKNNVLTAGPSSQYGIVVKTGSGDSAINNMVIEGNDLTDAGSLDRIAYSSAITRKLGYLCVVRNNAGHESICPYTGTFQLTAGTGQVSIDGLPFPPSKITFKAMVRDSGELAVCEGVSPFSGDAYCQQWATDGSVFEATANGVEAANRVIVLKTAAGGVHNIVSIQDHLGSTGLGFKLYKHTMSFAPLDVLYIAEP